ncbi:MAG: hypothetical protein ACI9DC_002315 [Gammaproteobacteria bacterium]|jgi:hypothetical protein
MTIDRARYLSYDANSFWFTLSVPQQERAREHE